jgi:hypothetical protein
MPAQLLWFEMDDIIVMAVGYVIANILGGWFWLAMVALPVPYMYIKKNKPRGFLKHSIFISGLYTFDGYPNYFAQKFRE